MSFIAKMRQRDALAAHLPGQETQRLRVVARHPDQVADRTVGLRPGLLYFHAMLGRFEMRQEDVASLFFLHRRYFHLIFMIG